MDFEIDGFSGNSAYFPLNLVTFENKLMNISLFCQNKLKDSVTDLGGEIITEPTGSRHPR